MGLSGHHGPRTEVRADSAPPALNKLDQRPLYIGLKGIGSTSTYMRGSILCKERNISLYLRRVSGIKMMEALSL